jgi:hypothetical protein
MMEQTKLERIISGGVLLALLVGCLLVVAPICFRFAVAGGVVFLYLAVL